MKQSSMEKYFKRIGITLIVMASIVLGVGQANALPVISTLGNPIVANSWLYGPTIGQAFTTGQSIAIGTATFSNDYFGYNDYNWTPTSGAYLTIQNNDGAGQIGSTVYSTWNTVSKSGNYVTYSGNYTLSANTTYWLVSHDTVNQAINWTANTSSLSSYGATIPETFSSFDSAGNQGSGYYTHSQVTSIFEVNPVPIPGAVWLLGSGLLGLVGLKRRSSRKA